MPRLRLALQISIISLATLIGSPSGAQNAVQRAVPSQLFEPAVGTSDILLSLEGATVVRHLGFAIGLMLNYQNDPLVLYIKNASDGSPDFDVDDADREIDLVGDQLTSDLYGVFGFRLKWLRAHVGFTLPVNLLLRGTDIDDQGQESGTFKGEGIGDLRLHFKAVLFQDLAGFSLAFPMVLTLPTACWSTGGASSCDEEGNFAGDPSVTFRPRLAAHYRYRDLLVVANVGGAFREGAQVFSSDFSHRLTYGVGAGYQVHRRVFAMAEIFGQAGFGTKSDCSADEQGETICTGTSSANLDAFPLELDFGAHVGLPKGFQLTAGVGFGLIQGLGSPQYRLIAGVRWAPDWRDADGDGVPDSEDACPTQAEDRDGFKDSDGCPELDNDEDLIPDASDKCPNQAEDVDRFEDHDGCPEPDNDRDGVPDLVDHCPTEPETVNKFRDEDGCPDVPDSDGDGVADAIDRCPNEAEDADGFEDTDGCPDPDNDADGIPDAYDDCPTDREDNDNFQDDDGCPDLDNDRDGVPDARDRCPNEKEVINGYKDDDGCPDKGKRYVEIKEDKIVIAKKVYFLSGKANIQRRSHSILNQVALLMAANPQIKRVRVEGHTDSRGALELNRKLSQARAESVRDYLVRRGVDIGRLEAVGHGPDKPIADDRTSAGRVKNRRVEFTILERTEPPSTPPQQRPDAGEAKQ